ncbi:hypothetical protein [Corynebacterium tuscaniense]|uniref:hypothetical protein n=1 Tax=Corynebacterium tuscaniense TaxID=302449 RepID=UPI001478E99A|nr:hypothetical protein [Corynebacterium tuscaniense]
MSIKRTIATATAIAIAAVSLVACNDSADKMDKMDGSMTPSSSAMMMEESK